MFRGSLIQGSLCTGVPFGMGPFGKFANKLKGQQKEAPNNGKGGMDSRADSSLEKDQALLNVKLVVGKEMADDSNRHGDRPRIEDLELKGNPMVPQVSRKTDFYLPGKVIKKFQESNTVTSNELDCLNTSQRESRDSTVKAKYKEIKCVPGEGRATMPCLTQGEGSPTEGGSIETNDSVQRSKNESAVQESPDLESSSLTLSLGLNRIKTRSGPLYADEEHQKQLVDKDQSEYGAISTVRDEYFQKDADDVSRSSQAKLRRKVKAETQRLQRYHSGRRLTDQMTIPIISQTFTSASISGCNTTEKAPQQHFPAHLQNVSLKSDLMLEKKVPSSLLSYLNHEFDEGFEMEVSAKQLDVIKEADSPTFQQPIPVSRHRISKKWPKDIKSFSHELGPRGGRSHDVQRPHSDNDLEELLAALRARFNTAKEEVDAELKYFAADLIEILDRNTDSFPEWKENVEDLLVLAQRCTKLSPVDFRRECEKIVHELDEHRQELPMGLLKQLHTRMLFILTRCTRLLQFQKESIPEEEGLHKVHQFLKGVPSVALSSGTGKRKVGTSKKLLSEVLEHSARDAGVPKLKSTRKHRLAVEKAKFTDDQPCSPQILNFRKLPPVSSDNIEPRDGTKGPTTGVHDESTVTPVESRWDQTECKVGDADLQIRQSQKSPWSPWGEIDKEESESVLCRICEEQVLTSQLQPHSFPCSLADAYDAQGNSIDERLRMLADGLEKIAENTVKNNHLMMDDSPDASRPFRVIAHDGSDNASPQSNDLKTVDIRLDDACISESGSVEDLRGLSLLNFKRLLGKTEQGVTSSSAGSGTPRSTLTTPRTSQLDLLWAERNSFAEQEDVSQIYELASIAREIANKSPTEEELQFSLSSCSDELHEVLSRNKVPALTIETFGKRIEKLLKEKALLLGGTIDARRLDSLSGSYDDDGMSTDDGVQSLRSTPTHPSCSDRISIEDFYLIKPISRGAFGKVLLAKKRSTGDLFAIKVLRKIDMIRKNAVENILAERDILISVCNPFVVRFFYSFTCRDNLYLVMEYLNGGDLYSLLRHMGCLEEDVARVYIAELVLALEYLHSLGVVHRDLKPDNILIAHDGHIKLTDFGLSKVGLINSTDDLSGPTNGTVLMEESMFENCGESALPRECRKERSAVGTPDYLAPEILLGTEHGYTADWWSVGVILFECITGLPPFNAEHPQIIFDNILNRKIPWPHVPEEMSNDAKNLIDRLLTEDPNQRLGAKGAGEVKSHPFFKDISWENLARQKAAFVPKPESVDDTSYFTSRHLESYANSSPRFGDSSDCETSCSSSNSMKVMLNEGDDDYGDISEFQRSPSVERTFNNFSFKNASQLAYMNYDILSQSGKDSMKGQHSRNQSIS